VGKKNFSERISGTNKATIIEHHRAVQWAEKEYINLLNVVQQSYSSLCSDLDSGVIPRPKDSGWPDARFMEYCWFMSPEPYTPEDQIRIHMQGGV
jgi:hypothetical protein